jgi:hypothetical protein
MVATVNPPTTKTVDEALRLVRHVMVEHARIEHENASNRGIPYIYLGELQGVTAHAYSGARLDEVLEHQVRPALEAPLVHHSDPRYASTATTKVDRVLVLLGALCTTLSLSPITNPGALNNLREQLSQLLGV